MNAPWATIGSLLDQANALKENFEKQLDEAVNNPRPSPDSLEEDVQVEPPQASPSEPDDPPPSGGVPEALPLPEAAAEATTTPTNAPPPSTTTTPLVASATSDSEALVASLKTKLAQEKRARLEAEAKAAGLLQEGLELSQKEGKAQALVKKLRHEKQATEEQLETSHTQLSASQSEAKELTRKLEETTRRLESTASLASTSQTTQSQLATSLKRESELQAKLDALTEEVRRLSEANRALQTERDDAQFQLGESLATKRVQGSRAETVERRLQETQTTLEEQIRESRKSEQTLREELQHALSLRRAAEEAAERAKHDAAAATTGLLSRIDALTKQVERGERLLAAASARAASSESQCVEARQITQALRQSHEELETKLEQLERRLDASQAELARARSEARGLERRLADRESEHQAAVQAWETLKTSYETRHLEARKTELGLRSSLQKETALREEAQERLSEARKDAASWRARAATTLPVPLSPLHSSPRSVELNSSLESVPTGSATLEQLPVRSPPTQEGILADALRLTAPSGFPPSELPNLIAGPPSSHHLEASRLRVLSQRLEDEQARSTRLSNELMDLERRFRASETAQRESADATRRNAVLLELLGEAQETIEGLRVDVATLKQSLVELAVSQTT